MLEAVDCTPLYNATTSFFAVFEVPKDGPWAGELVLEVVNRTPLRDAFSFACVENGLRAAGAYRLEYEMAPAVPGCAPLALAVELLVAPGAAVGFEIQARACSCPNFSLPHAAQEQA